MKVAAILESKMPERKGGELARLIEAGVETHPGEVPPAAPPYDGTHARLVAYWNSAAALDEHRAASPGLREQALVREVGYEPEVSTVEVVALG